MEFVAGWLVCGAIAACWFMLALTFNTQGWADFVGEMFSRFPQEYKKLLMVAIPLMYFLIGPLGLADILRSIYLSRGRWKD